MSNLSQNTISDYNVVAAINEEHNVYLVQHQPSGKFYVKKTLDVYNSTVYKYLKEFPIPGIPKIVEAVEFNDELILIEEYISGSSLREIIISRSLTKSRIIKYMKNLCEIIYELHSINPPIIHRDIKPSNIIIDNNDNIILLDFNAAKFCNETSASDTVLLGTHGYAAPEQYGFGSSSEQTDIYAIGVLLKELMLSLNTQDDAFDSIIAKCTQLNPTDRYKSVLALTSALDSLTSKQSRNASNVMQTLSTYIPPGYRSKKPWKMILATIVYVSIFAICLAMKSTTTSVFFLYLERMTCAFIFLAIIFGCFNYRDIQRFIPLCKHKNPVIHYIGIVLLILALISISIVSLAIIETIFPLS